MKKMLRLSTLAIVTALVLPAVAGCKSCEGGACAISASETGKTVCKTAKCGDKTCDSCPAKKDGSSCSSKGACQKGSCRTDKPVIGTTALKTLMDASTPLVLLDARTGKYDDGNRIPGAIQLSPEASAEEVAKAAPSKDALVVTYCSNLKCQASARLAEALKKQGYKNVLEYSAGIAGWAEAGNKVVKEAEK